MSRPGKASERVVRDPRRPGVWHGERYEGGRLRVFVTGAKSEAQAREQLRAPKPT